MIPLKLQLKNFLSYGNTVQTIDFRPHHLICLSGKNGHGKSALLDAITWAIWGQARKVSNAPKADAHLLKLGQTQMMVCLDFMCNGQTYRVRREYMQTYGKPVLSLDFGVLNEKEELTPLTDKTIRATQHIIEQTLRLNFDAFVNSAFLRQGQANEFSKKSPKERKEIFAQILGLQEYEAVRKLATEKAKDALNEKNSICLYQDKITTELQQTELITTQLQELDVALGNLCLQQAQYEQHKTCCEQEKKLLTQRHKEYELLRYQAQEMSNKEAQTRTTLTQLEQEWKTIETLHAQAPDLKLLEEQKKELLTSINTHQKVFQQLLELKERLLHAQMKLSQVEHTIHEERALIVQKKTGLVERTLINLEATDTKLKELLSSLELQNKECSLLESRMGQLSTIISTQAVDEQVFATLEQKLAQGKEAYQQMIARGNFAQQELVSLEHKEKLSYDDENPCCPLCEQNLSVSRKRFLKTKLSEQKTALSEQIAHITRELNTLKKDLLTEHAHYEQQKKKREENIALTTQHAELVKQKEQLATASNTLKQTILQTQTLQAQLTLDVLQAKNELVQEQKKNNQVLTENQEWKSLKEESNSLENSLRTLTYNEQQHKQAIAAVQALDQEISRWSDLQTQKALQVEREKQMSAARQELAGITQQIHELTQKTKPYDQLLEQEAALLTQEQEITSLLQSCTRDKDTLLQKKGALENQKTKLVKLQLDYQEQAQKMCALETAADDYYEIAAATSKDGIQALLIENAIPEIEQEANLLLGKLTNNQAQIFIESLRDLKKGGTKETLDINISDAAGIRPYEMFSGGEAFRIDFALRIAISKLLARRAGTSLQTLIIDEGFGSQDEEGLGHIMDALYKIQDDFLKVIIVSHLPSMKDQFPVHFVIEKGAEGSRISVVELD